MGTACVVFAESDRALVERAVLPCLGPLGYEMWLPSTGAAPRLEGCAAALVIVTPAAIADESFCAAAGAAVSLRARCIPILFDEVPAEKLGGGLSGLAAIRPAASTANVSANELARPLMGMLPPPMGAERPVAGASHGPWSEGVCSALLADAIARHDHDVTDAIVAAFERECKHRTQPYDGKAAAADLLALRRRRQFPLMRRYALAAVRTGTEEPAVRRHLGQALIELHDYDRAVDVLEKLTGGLPGNHPEYLEARGLLGRAFKQQYVNAPQSQAAASNLGRAIDNYWPVFRDDHEQVWHGINAASVGLRARRDKVPCPETMEPRDVAKTILGVLDKRGTLAMWDIATAVEARVILRDFEGARTVLDAYLAHPEMHAFEVSSTHRQFEEVLQLENDEQGRELLDRLSSAVRRFRLGTIEHDTLAPNDRVRLLVRVSDPDWTGSNIPDLAEGSRLGNIVSLSGTARTLRALLKDPRVVSLQESRPAGTEECRKSVPLIRVPRALTPPTGDEDGSHAVIALIDGGIDVLHEAFRDETGKSRIAQIWDQRDPTGPAPDGFTFGTLHDAAKIASYVSTGNVPAALGRDPEGHGTHVASIAAGRACGANFAGGVAPGAQLLVVISAAQQSIGYSDAHIKALAFIDKFATVAGKPVVVNVSQGMNAGAHDGRSALEAGFDGFTGGGRTPGRVVIKSAGNDGDKRGHACINVLPKGIETLQWTCWPDPAAPHQERIELWWKANNGYRFRLVAPDPFPTSDWVDAATPKVSGRLKPGGPFTMQFVNRHVDNGDSVLTIEIGNGGLIASGQWGLQIVHVDGPGGSIEAWIERSGPTPSEFDTFVATNTTLTIPGTANNVITVGAIQTTEIDNVVRIGAAAFSAYGKTRDGREKPDVSAPGMKIEAARSETAQDTAVMDGTSMAAPFVAGAVALLLSRSQRNGGDWPASSQVASALQQKTQNYGPYNPQQGFGMIDVNAFLAAF